MKIQKDKQRVENFAKNPFIDGPGQFLAKAMCEELVAVQEFKYIFGEFIDPYMRVDYQMSNFPALRIYNEAYRKDYESWWVTGDIMMDVIYPANIRRKELQFIPDQLCAALLQQFRRPVFFDSIESQVPGLNEIGKVFSADKTLGFQWQDGILPLSQITVNFRIDLREWDSYLEANDRTKDDPFNKTLANLQEISTQINLMKEQANGPDVIEISLQADTKLKGE